MSEHLVFLLLGLGNGATFAALALALVLTYRSSGVVNFATGAIALYTAYTYSFLRRGELFIPLPGLPRSIDLGGDVGLVGGMAIALLLAGLLGGLLYLVVFRPLRTAPAVAKAVASVGVMVVIQGLLAQRLGTNPVMVRPIFPRDTYTLGDVRVPGDRLWFAASIAAVALLLSVMMRLTRFGLATRAAAESEKGAIVTGLSPTRIALANWVLSAVVAGLGGILIAPIVPLVPAAYTLFIVPALAAALVAGFGGLGTAVAVGLLVGMLQSELAHLQTLHTWLPERGLAELVPLVLILILLVVRGRPLPQRGALVLRTLGTAPRPRRIALPATVGAIMGVAALLLTSGSYRAGLIVSFILAMLALSLVVVTGFAGQVSLVQLSLAGVGAFTLSRLTTNLGVPFPIAPLAAATAAMAVGVVVGLPALRIRGLPVAVVTLALAVALDAAWFNNPDLTGGPQGARVEPPTMLGLDLGVGSGHAFPRPAFGLVCLAALVAVSCGVAWLRNSRLGAAMLAVRANERSAAASGINVARTKLLAFAIAAFIAGLAGSMLAYEQTIATPDTYSPMAGLGFFTTAYLAGVTSLLGGLLAGVFAAGGLVYIAVNRVLSLGGWYTAITGAGLVNVTVRRPEGLVAPLHALAHRRRPTVWDSGQRPSTGDLIAAATAEGGIGEPSAGPGSPILTLQDVGVRFGGVIAVDDLTLDVPAGSITGIIGPNGAGKTTLIDAIGGFVSSTGTIYLQGQPIDGLKPYQRVRLGLGRTFQGIDLYDDLTVAENIVVGQQAARHADDMGVMTWAADPYSLCDLLDIADVRDRPARELSQGQRQLVSVARALAGRPGLLMLDEPAGGLDSSESAWLAERLHVVRDAGVTIVLVDHDMSLVLNVCDLIHVLDLGRLIESGSPAAIQSNPAVLAAYLGTAHVAVGAP